MSANTEILYTDEKPVMGTDEKQDPTLDYSPDASTPRDGDQWRHGIDDAHERRILRKLDYHSLPFISLLYLMSNL
jgi:hypothetical protein